MVQSGRTHRGDFSGRPYTSGLVPAGSGATTLRPPATRKGQVSPSVTEKDGSLKRAASRQDRHRGSPLRLRLDDAITMTIVHIWTLANNGQCGSSADFSRTVRRVRYEVLRPFGGDHDASVNERRWTVTSGSGPVRRKAGRSIGSP